MIIRLILSLGLMAAMIAAPAAVTATDEQPVPVPFAELIDCDAPEGAVCAAPMPFLEPMPIEGCATQGFDPNGASPTDPFPCPEPILGGCFTDANGMTVCYDTPSPTEVVPDCAISSDGTSTCDGLPLFENPDRRVIETLSHVGGRVITSVGGFLLIENGRLTASAGCNTLSAEVTVDGNRLELGPLLSTRMWCPDVAEAEVLLIAILEGENLSWISDTDLRSAKGAISLRMERVDYDDDLTDAAGGASIVTVTVSETRYAVNGGHFLIENSSLSASVGCNSLFGEATIENEAITLGAIGMTEMYCTELNDAEQAFLAVLSSANLRFVDAATITSDAGSITLTVVDGERAPVSDADQGTGISWLALVLLFGPALAGLGAITVGLSPRE
jgi:heat shock protein HslJ